MSWFSRTPTSVDDIEIVGAPRAPLSDAYHLLLRMPWTLDLLLLGGTFGVLNLCFAAAYFFVGGVSGARPGSFLDLFFFSVETMGTIGYGEMFPTTSAAHALVTCESFFGIVLVALTTGLVFTKFSIPRARMQFAKHGALAPFDGVPTLMFRLGNERSTRILEATVRAILIRTEKTVEGVVIYRMIDLKLERERSPALARYWTVLHRVTPDSPLHKATPESLAAQEVEFLLSVVGTDETSAQPMHARWRYMHHEVVFGKRHADMLSERPDGGLRLDMAHFNQMVPTKPTPDFPFPVEKSAAG